MKNYVKIYFPYFSFFLVFNHDFIAYTDLRVSNFNHSHSNWWRRHKL